MKIQLKLKQFAVNNLQFLVKRIPFNYKEYWKRQYDKHGLNPTYCGGCGDKMTFQYIFRRFDELIKGFNINVDSSVLDIGCGAGVYADYFQKKGFRNYKGIDLSKEMVNELSKKFNAYEFEEKDISKEKITGKYDIIIMISVTQHILLDKHFEFVMKQINDLLNNNGLFFVIDYFGIDKREALNQRWRPLSYYRKILPNLAYTGRINFRNDSPKQLFIFKNNMLQENELQKEI